MYVRASETIRAMAAETPWHAAGFAGLVEGSGCVRLAQILGLAGAAPGHGPPQLGHILAIVAGHALRGCLIRMK